VTNGLILLVFLAALTALGWIRLRRRMGMSVTGKTFLTVMVVFVLVVLALWAYSQR
jgi:fumarate reductase subunit D